MTVYQAKGSTTIHSSQAAIQQAVQPPAAHEKPSKTPSQAEKRKKAHRSPDDSFEVFPLNEEHDPKELFNVSPATILRILYHQNQKRGNQIELNGTTQSSFHISP